MDGPLITTTTINVIRFIGKYITMMKVLQPISYEIYQAITQLSEYYTYTIFSFFGEMPNGKFLAGKFPFDWYPFHFFGGKIFFFQNISEAG